ncbi:MAG: hypothetical protein IH858_10710 [Chloroflexi bacterium]|nr:hypothetical protein [Chloroflexota bacterium]
MPKRTARDKKLTQLAGEYAVASELAKRGWLPVVLPANWPGYDVLAQSEGGRVVRVQVKSRGVPSKLAFCPDGDCPYPVVFVQAWDSPFQFFPVPGPDVERLRDEEGRTSAMISFANLEDFRGRWDLILGGKDE